MLARVQLLASTLFKVSTQTGIRQPTLPLLAKNIVSFSTISQHKIFDMIQREKNEQNLGRIFIQMAGVNNQIRHNAIKLLLERIIDGQFSAEVINNEKFKVHLKKHPQLMFQAFFFKIGDGLNRLVQIIEEEQQVGKKEAVKEINQSFATCFDTLKKMQGDEAPLREIQLYKSFAHYHCTFLKNIVDESKAKLCLSKGRDFYKGTLTKIVMHAKVFLQRRKKLMQQAQSNQIEIPKSQNQDSIASINQNLFKLFEFFSESLNELIDIESQIHEIENPIPEEELQKEQQETKIQQGSQLKNPEELISEDEKGQWRYQYPNNVVALEPLIQKGIGNYVLVKDLIFKSQFYYKLKKILQQIRFQRQIRNIQLDEEHKDQQIELKKKAHQQLVENMNTIFAEALEDYKKFSTQQEDPEHLEEQAMLLVEIKMHSYQLVDFNQSSLQVELGKEIQQIVNIIQQDKLRKQILNEIISFIKQTYEIDISKYVQKIPRVMRIGRRFNRTQVL